MTELSVINQTLTMSSLEIAELTDKRHDNVVRDIRNMLIELDEGGLLKFEETHVGQQNQQEYKYYNLPKREALILISGYAVKMRAKIIDRWQELENQHRYHSHIMHNTVRISTLWLAQTLDRTHAQLKDRAVKIFNDMKMDASPFIFEYTDGHKQNNYYLSLPSDIALQIVNNSKSIYKDEILEELNNEIDRQSKKSATLIAI